MDEGVKLIAEIRKLINNNQVKLLSDKLADLHPADLATILAETSDEETEVLLDLVSEEALADILAEVNYEV
ncbi:MAG: magnesium transporter, partial [Bacillota bacterium]